jgi:hypothetical protein
MLQKSDYADAIYNVKVKLLALLAEPDEEKKSSFSNVLELAYIKAFEQVASSMNGSVKPVKDIHGDASYQWASRDTVMKHAHHQVLEDVAEIIASTRSSSAEEDKVFLRSDHEETLGFIKSSCQEQYLLGQHRILEVMLRAVQHPGA